MKSIAFGHGRTHRILSSINYSSSVFVDRNITCHPDILLDLVNQDLSPLLSLVNFDEAVMVCCSSMVLLKNQSLNIPFLNSVYQCLKPGGKFYISNVYYHYPKYQKKDQERDKLCHDIQTHVNFLYIGEEQRLDIQRGTMLVFVKM